MEFYNNKSSEKNKCMNYNKKKYAESFENFRGT